LGVMRNSFALIKMTKYFKILLLFFLLSCSDSHPLVGIWKVKNYSLWEKGIAYLKGVRGLVSGTELVLNSDSTYKKTTCGNIIIGKWYAKNDSLFLNSDTSWFRMNYTTSGGRLDKNQESYLVKGNKLVQYYKGMIKIEMGDSTFKHRYIFSMEILK